LIMQTDTPERCLLYTDYEKASRWFAMRDYERLKDSGEITVQEFAVHFSATQVATISAEYANVKANYHPSQPGTFGWAWKVFAKGQHDKNPTLKQIAKHLGRGSEYVRLYSVLSAISHPSSIGRKAMTTSDGLTVPCFLFNDKTRAYAGLALGY